MTGVVCPSFLSLPSVRFLYDPCSDMRYTIVRRAGEDGFWIVEEGWTIGSRAAGPFHPHDVLRAYVLVHTSVPDGCALGPWQRGIEIFEPSDLPGHPNEWSAIDPGWFGPSITLYSEADIDADAYCGCCGPPHDRPRIDWTAIEGCDRDDVLSLVNSRFPALRPIEVGILSRTWDLHATGSPVVAQAKTLRGEFAVVDYPPAPDDEDRWLKTCWG